MRRIWARFPDERYRGRVWVSATVCTQGRAVGLHDPQVVAACLPMLSDARDRFECQIGVYCFMPDHLHLLVGGRKEASEPKALVDSFKRRSGIWLARNRPDLRWQKGWYDHVIRADRDLIGQAKYIALNPIRAGLVEAIEDWPGTGTFEGNLAEVVQEIWW